MNYPDNWPCERCKNPYSMHVKIGEPDGTSVATHEWCLKWTTDPAQQSYKQGWYFTPMDNLSVIEHEAKEKGL